VVDLAVVGPDGRAATTSPPYAGVLASSQYLFARNEQARWFRLTEYYANSNIEVITSGPQGQRAYFVRPNEFYGGLYPLPANAVAIRVWRFAADGSARDAQGNATVGTAVVELPPVGGVFVTHVAVPDPNFSEQIPYLNSAQIAWTPNTSGVVTGTVTIHGQNFGTNKNDLTVIFIRDPLFRLADFDAGGYLPGDFYRVDGSQLTSVTDQTITLALPNIPGLTRYSILVERKFEVWQWQGGRDPQRAYVTKRSPFDQKPSVAAPSYVWVANNTTNTVSVINPLADDGPAVVANIPVGRGPTGVAVTNDGLLALVVNTTDATVSFIDTITLREIDLDPNDAEPITRLQLPRGGLPWDIAIHPGQMAPRKAPPLTWWLPLRGARPIMAVTWWWRRAICLPRGCRCIPARRFASSRSCWGPNPLAWRQGGLPPKWA
jgi:YVTN family beta-propeller protein